MNIRPKQDYLTGTSLSSVRRLNPDLIPVAASTLRELSGQGNLAGVRSFLDKGREFVSQDAKAVLNGQSADGNTALMLAIQNCISLRTEPTEPISPNQKALVHIAIDLIKAGSDLISLKGGYEGRKSAFEWANSLAQMGIPAVKEEMEKSIPLASQLKRVDDMTPTSLLINHREYQDGLLRGGLSISLTDPIGMPPIIRVSPPKIQEIMPIKLTDLHIDPGKLSELVSSILQYGILTEKDAIARGIIPAVSADATQVPQEFVRLNLIGLRGGDAGEVVNASLTVRAKGSFSVSIEQKKDTILARRGDDLTTHDAQLELSERALHTALLVVDPRVVDQFYQSSGYSSKFVSEASTAPPYEVRMSTSIHPEEIQCVLVPEFLDTVSIRNDRNVSLINVGYTMESVHYLERPVKILVPNYAPVLEEIINDNGVMYTHITRATPPDDIEIRDLISHAIEATEKNDTASKTVFINLLAEKGDSGINGFIQLGDFFYAKGDFESQKKAGLFYEKARTDQPSNSDAHLKLANVFISLATTHSFRPETLIPKAIKCLEGALEINPANIQIQTRLHEIIEMLPK